MLAGPGWGAGQRLQAGLLKVESGLRVHTQSQAIMISFHVGLGLSVQVTPDGVTVTVAVMVNCDKLEESNLEENIIHAARACHGH